MLKYQHNGFIPGVPARDLTDEEAAIHGKRRLLASGHYQEIRERKARTKEIEQPAEEKRAEE